MLKPNSDTSGVLLLSILNAGGGNPLIDGKYFPRERVSTLAGALVLIELVAARALGMVDGYLVKLPSPRIDEDIARELFAILPDSFLFDNEAAFIGAEALGKYSRMKRTIMSGDLPYSGVEEVETYFRLNGYFGGSYAMEALCGLMTIDTERIDDLGKMVLKYDYVPLLNTEDTIWGEMYSLELNHVDKIRWSIQ